MNQRSSLSALSLALLAPPAFAQAPPAGAPAPAPAATPPAAAAPGPAPAPAPAPAPETEPPKREKEGDAPDELAVAKTGFFQPSANIQVWWLASHLADHDPKTDGEWTNIFRIRRAELKIKGDIIPNTVAYQVVFDPARLLDFQSKNVAVSGQDPAPTTAGTVAVPQAPSNGNTSILQDAAITFISDYADVSIGQYKIPVSLEGAGSASKLYFPERALVSRRFGDRRDVGVKAEKKLGMFGYTLGVFSGEGQNRLDTNDQKDLALRLEVYPIQGLTLAAVGYTSVTERDLLGTKDRLEGDLKLELNDVLVQAEYIRGWDTAAVAPAPRLQGQGFYVLAGYTLFEKLQPIVRIGSLDPDIDRDEHGSTTIDPNDETTTYELGVNYYLQKHDCKLQLAGAFFDPEQKVQHTRFDLTLAAQVAF